MRCSCLWVYAPAGREARGVGAGAASPLVFPQRRNCPLAWRQAAACSAASATRASTMVLPMGHRARAASLTCCQAKGMPMMVTAQAGREQMPAGDPDTAEQQPDDIAHGAQRAGADVAFAGKDVTGDRHAAEGHEGETGHDEAGPAPGDADDADEAEHARDAPEQAGTQTEGEEPEDIAETAQSLHGKLLKKRGWSIHATRGRGDCPCAGGGMGEACGEDAAWCGHLPLSIEEEGPHAGWPSGRRPGRIRQ